MLKMQNNQLGLFLGTFLLCTLLINLLTTGVFALEQSAYDLNPTTLAVEETFQSQQEELSATTTLETQTGYQFTTLSLTERAEQKSLPQEVTMGAAELLTVGFVCLVLVSMVFVQRRFRL